MSLQNKKILIVEDDEMNFIYLSQIFRIAQIAVVHAKTGYEAIDLINSDNEIDLILMDIQLPDISGIEATEKIRKYRPDLPIIAQTAFRGDYDKDAILNAGCTDVLIKPFMMDELLTKIREYLS